MLSIDTHPHLNPCVMHKFVDPLLSTFALPSGVLIYSWKIRAVWTDQRTVGTLLLISFEEVHSETKVNIKTFSSVQMSRECDLDG